MLIRVKLSDIFEGIDMQFDGYSTFLHTKTGTVLSVADDSLRTAEDGEPVDHLSKWQQEEHETAIDIIENDEDYVRLPNQYEIHEYEMIEDFCFTIQKKETRERLFKAIKCKGAFRRFKDTIQVLGIEDDWFTYRDDRYKQIAKEWCQENNINFIQ
ncbi:UPF0158 family protein [Alkalihalobacillus sp. AL-G]|uniref:UPF0158 family protein n=1 Tax=Alkalihalobacillus sp. AL-G TaxID=2926399 RepID=UPI002729F2EE|nr:UPF0158 family protein [Alkalihalobacillus sp. AL-G]WLD92575.1 UPF0158 family protein [Alkalihalobacillus sp. AL-G]